MLLTLVASVVGLILIISAIMMLRYRAPAKDSAAILYARFVRKTKLEISVGETAQEFAERVAESRSVPESEIEAVTSAYHDARYGRDGDTALPQLHLAVAAVRKT